MAVVASVDDDAAPISCGSWIVSWNWMWLCLMLLVLYPCEGWWIYERLCVGRLDWLLLCSLCPLWIG